MSDAAIASIVTGIVTVATMIGGVITLWIKTKYGTERAEAAAAKVGKKVDENTSLTSEVKTAAEKASQHVEGCDERMRTLNNRLADHDRRIGEVELKVESINKNVDSTRHEMRGHLQSLGNKLDLIMLAKSKEDK